MTVEDCMREIRMAEDAIDTLDKYESGEMAGIAKQHIQEIRSVILKYIRLVYEKEVK